MDDHDADVIPVRQGDETLGPPDGFVDRRLAGWARRGVLAVGQSDDFDEAHRLLTSSQPASRTRCIVHNDFKLDNCMFSIDRPTASRPSSTGT